MSARLKSRRVPSRAMLLGYNLPAINRHSHEKPGQDSDCDREKPHDHFGQFTGSKYRREAAHQDREANGEQEHKQTEEPNHSAAFQQLGGAGENRREELVAPHHSSLMLSDFLELAALRRE